MGRLILCMRFCIAFAAFIAMSAVAVRAQNSGNDLVKATLLADCDAIVPGKPLTLGVLFKIEPAWHIYWKYSGDSGMPTRVKWKLPEGFSSRDLLFPMPTMFDQSGVVAYGYTDEVMLLTRIIPPAELATNQKVQLSADVNWLVCDKVCLPGKAHVSIELAVRDKNAPANAELFAKWRSQMPRQILAHPIDAARTGKETFETTVKWTAPATDVKWFPVPPEGSGIEKSQTSNAPDTSSFSFALAPPPDSAATMSFVVTYRDADGKQNGVEFTVNLPPVKR